MGCNLISKMTASRGKALREEEAVKEEPSRVGSLSLLKSPESCPLHPTGVNAERRLEPTIYEHLTLVLQPPEL